MDGMVITHLDPWMAEPRGAGATRGWIPVGRYELWIGIDTLTEAGFLAGGDGRWEWWSVLAGSGAALDRFLADPGDPACQGIGGILRQGLAVAGTLDGSPEEAARGLFEVLVRSRTNADFLAPYVGGLLSAEALAGIVAEVQAERERHHQAALQAERAAPSAILTMARSLGMDPRPAGHSATAWLANCPSGGQHSIMLSSTSDTFGCGYCRRKGGSEELRAFRSEWRRKRGLGG